MIKYLTSFVLLICSTTLLFAGPRSTPNATIVDSAEVATNGAITDAVTISTTLSARVDLALSSVPNSQAAAISSLSAILNINGTSVTVTQNASGNAFVNGQPLVINGLPNLGLLMSLGYK